MKIKQNGYKMTYKYMLAIALVGGLSACSSDNDKSASNTTPKPDKPVVVEPAFTPVAFADKMIERNNIIAFIDAGIADASLTDDFVLPLSGTAEYAGTMQMPNPIAAGGIIGQFEMGVDFASADVTGAAGDFSNANNEVWSGELAIDGNFTTAVDVTGTLTSMGGIDTAIVAVAAGHTNYGSSAPGPQTPDAIEGWLVGTATTDGVADILDGINTLYDGVLQ